VSLRVVAGRVGGRRLDAPPGGGTRPTADRVREALFSILGPLDGLAVCDLFAGSGALGIEALSRGASAATFVDDDPGAARVIRANLASLGLEGRVVRRDVLAFLPGAGPFDLVVCDPPYSSAPRLAGPLSELLPPALAAAARIVTESDKRNPLTLDLPLEAERIYGDTRVAVHRGP
jgi:16S rRNA (guanine966-N2)-methyltransferase